MMHPFLPLNPLQPRPKSCMASEGLKKQIPSSNLILTDVGRPVAHIVSNLVGYSSLVADVQAVLDTLVSKEVPVQTAEGKAVAPLTPEAQADVEAGLGKYWRMMADAREEAGDAAGASTALERSIGHYRAATTARSDCLAALNALIQLLYRTGAADAEIDALKAQLSRLKAKEDSGGGEAERSTFC